MKKTFTRKDYVRVFDEVFSLYIRLRDADKDGFITCPLCGAKIHWTKAQNMHFIPRGCYLYRWSEINCYGGCLRCNVILHGNYIVYTRRMQKKYGVEFVDKMINDKYKVHKITTADIIDGIKHYLGEIDEIIKKKYKNKSDFSSLLKKYNKAFTP